MGTKENIAALKGGASAVASGVTTLNTNLDELEKSFANNEKLLKALEPLEATSADVKTAIETLKVVTQKQKESIQQLKAATAKDSKLQTGANQVSCRCGNGNGRTGRIVKEFLVSHQCIF